MILLDADKQPVSSMAVVDLKEESSTATEEPLEIIGSLEPEAYGIDMAGIQL